MADIKTIEEQLKKIGCNFRFWGRAELKELATILLPNEEINHCINGQYEGGFAMLCATNQRVLLIDKKPMYLTLEDIRFDMIAELDYNHRLVNATMLICTPNKSLRFSAYNQGRLRNFYIYVQQRVMDIRQHYMQQMQQQEQEAAVSTTPGQFPVPAAAYALPQGQQPQPTFSAAQFAQLKQQLQQPAPQPQPQQQLRHHLVPPIISAYTRLPLMSRQRRYLGSRVLNSIYSSAKTNVSLSGQSQ